MKSGISISCYQYPLQFFGNKKWAFSRLSKSKQGENGRRIITSLAIVLTISNCADIQTTQAQAKFNDVAPMEITLANPAIVKNAKPDAEGWIMKFDDKGETPWQDNWFMDGRFSKVTNTHKGLKVEAGPEAQNDAHHTVLWTKHQYDGDIKIEYDFTKIDDEIKMVNILYIQATGTGDFAQDIATWRHQRQVPSMKFYFERMKALHISYAAFGQTNVESEQDYIRARVYPLHPTKGFAGMKIPPSYKETSLFKKGRTYHITAVKTEDKLTFSVRLKNTPETKTQVFSWDLPERGKVDTGRIGLRQMYTRSSIYNNFKIYTRE
ncbi:MULTISPECIES: DUF1961 family protein [unclassified Alteromonas]|uniref:DUF1961 family protein n=1 Tax=unclassified Alteromonas TaxID=2614992 RepID=UPI000690BF88|nr:MULTISPECIES: DUF1961 family protein [unclassified Alteromonas]